MSETAVERRLREMAERRRKVAVGRVEASWLPEYERLTGAIDAGCAAIALLRDWDENETPQDGPSREWKTRVAALLARCKGES